MTTALLVAAVAMAVAFAQGVAGFGFALLAVPAFACFIPVKEAVVLSTIVGAANSGYQAVLLRSSIDWIRARRYLAGSFMGAPLGLAVFLVASPDLLRAVVGVAVLVGTAFIMKGATTGPHQPRLDGAMSFVSGVLLTSTSTNGPPLVLALRAQGVVPDVFRATLASVFAVTGAAASLAFAFAGDVGHRSVALAVAALPAVAAGARLGYRTRTRVEGPAFTGIVVALLVAGAVSSIAPLVIRAVG